MKKEICDSLNLVSSPTKALTSGPERVEWGRPFPCAYLPQFDALSP